MHTPVSPTLSEKADAFAALHQRPGGFVIPNPWDVGSARLLRHLGFKALAGTSAGYAFSRGQPDNTIPRDELLAHLRDIAAATDLPVSADLGCGFGDTPEAAADTIRRAGETGIVGGSIEDHSGRPEDAPYPLALATERVRAAVAAARALPFRFTLTARAENFFIGRRDLADTIARLQAFQEAGADVLYAPGLVTEQDVATVRREIDRPLNMLLGMPGMTLTAPELGRLGINRISVGGSLARAAYGELLRAATELRDAGTFGYTARAVPGAELNRLFAPHAPGAD